MEKKEKGRNR